MQKTEYLFVYGSLRKALRNPMSSVLTRYGAYVGEAILRGKLYDLGSYPGVVLSEQPSEVVHGELFRLRDKDRVFSILDPYEGYNPRDPRSGEFRRARAPIMLTNGATVHGWVYLYCQTTKGLRPICSGDYLSYRGGKSKGGKS